MIEFFSPRAWVIAGTVGLLAAATQPASAVTFGIAGLSDPVNNTATVDFDYDASAGKITVGITNTADGDDPRITGFAFNVPDSVTGVSSFMADGTENDGAWSSLFASDDVDTPMNLGFFDLAGRSNDNGNSGINGGSPNAGIDNGETATFMFVLSGEILGSLTADSFLSLLSAPGNGQSSLYSFAVRFQRTGEDGEGSDVGVPGDTSEVPIPASLPLFLAALGGIGLLARRRKV